MRLSIVALLLLTLAPGLRAEEHVWSERPNSAPTTIQLPDFATLADLAMPAVVSIQVEQKSPRRQNDSFDFFFGPFGDVPREFHNRGLGSGFVISKDGLVLTNYHVVEDAQSIEVTLSSKDGIDKKVEASVLGTAPEYDIALLQAKGVSDIPVAYLGDSDKVRIGEWVLAIGNPFGLAHSASVGIISAKERRDIAPSGRPGLYDFLQTDASINPGNSGGPLINSRGEVIGINSAINASGSGIGFAIPINMVKNMLTDLKTKGRYARSWIGIKIQPLTPELAQSYGLPKPLGALVSEVVNESPAKEAGLLEGDIILEFDGKPVRSSTDLPLYASMGGVGKKVSIKYWRNRKESTVMLKLTEYPSEEAKVAEADDAGEGEGLGLVAADLTPQLQKELGIETASGVVVKSIEPGSAAARNGLRLGDVIMSLNGEAMARARSFAEAVHKVERGGLLRMQVLRQGGKVFVAMRKP
jgi:serine protease Do